MVCYTKRKKKKRKEKIILGSFVELDQKVASNKLLVPQKHKSKVT